jgi:hypothetical protein
VCYPVDKERLACAELEPRQDRGNDTLVDWRLPSPQNALPESWCGWAVSPPAFPGPMQVGQSRLEGRGLLLGLIPWMSRRCLILSALPFGSYEKGETVRPLLRARTDDKPTEVSCRLLLSLHRTPFTTTGTLTPSVLGGVPSRDSSCMSSNGTAASSLGAGVSSR